MLDGQGEALVRFGRQPVDAWHDPLFQAFQGALEFWDAEEGMFDGARLFPVEDIWYVAAHGASDMGVKCGERVPVFRLEAIQNGLEDGVGVIGEASNGGCV